MQLELDVFWVSVAGNIRADLEIIRRPRSAGSFEGQIAKTFTKTQFNENVLHSAFESVGSGSLDFPAILSVAPLPAFGSISSSQDQSVGSPIAALRKSYDYLKTQFK